MSIDIDPAWLAPTHFIDSETAAVAEYAEEAIGDATDEVEVAVALFHAVRDGIRYDPYIKQDTDDDFRASVVAGTPANWCTPKSVLLTAAARNRGIPARLGFADVKNHLTSEKLSAQMGTDLFAWHGYSVLHVAGEWRKVSSAFNIELCQKFGVKVLEFDGLSDSLMHPFDEEGRRHMEYVNQRGTFDELPLAEIQADFAEIYGDWQNSDADEAFAG